MNLSTIDKLEKDDEFYSFDFEDKKIYKWKVINVKLYYLSKKKQRKVYEVKELEYDKKIKQNFYINWIFTEDELKFNCSLTPKVFEEYITHSDYQDKVLLRQKLRQVDKERKYYD